MIFPCGGGGIIKSGSAVSTKRTFSPPCNCVADTMNALHFPEPMLCRMVRRAAS